MKKLTAKLRLAQILAFLLVGVLPLGTARSEPLPSVATLGTPQEIALASEAAQLMQSAIDPTVRLARLDGLLERLPTPSKARGYVQMTRAATLTAMNRKIDSLIAVEESIRLLHGYSIPLYLAADAHAFSTTPGVAVDYFIRASRIDAQPLRSMTSYDVRQLLRRLKSLGERDESEAFIQRLLDVSWRGDDLGTHSQILRQFIELRLSHKDTAMAQAYVTQLLDPEDMYRLLLNNEAEAVWPTVTAWAGPRLAKQWPIYLNEARERFEARKELDAAVEYLGALSDAGHDQTIMREIWPLFSRPDKAAQSDALLFAAAPMARTLARLTRWQDLETMYARLEAEWPLGSTINALNLSINHARYLHHAGKLSDALILIDRSLIESAKEREMLNLDALAAMHKIRACILHGMGRTAEISRDVALASANVFADPAGLAEMYICLDRPEDARSVLLRALEVELLRPQILFALQPRRTSLIPSALGVKIAAGWSSLRKDQRLMSEVRKFGRILDFDIASAAPEEQVRWIP